MLNKNLSSQKGMVVLAFVLFLGAILFGNTAHAIAGPPCEGNFDCDADVDGSDLAVFAADFGRTDCPACGPAPVGKTGQTTSYATGDDGDLENGVAWPNPRFTDNEDGTVTDNLTGLIWLKNANCFGAKPWSTALSDCNQLGDGQCGLTDGSVAGDWCLPNLRQLHSLIDYSQEDPALTSGHPFVNVWFGEPSSLYWSGTTDAGEAGTAWGVTMGGGGVDDPGKTDNGYVWPVRRHN